MSSAVGGPEPGATVRRRAPESLAPPAQPRARLDQALRTFAGTLLTLGLALPTYWWASGGGITDLGGWSTGLMSVGRITGLVASVLLLAQVVLMARVPALEQAYGQDHLAHIHRVVGFTSFNLMLTHVLLITWAYSGGSLPGWPGMFWQLTWQDAGMLLAVAGTFALVGVTVTSIRIARARLRYESWHLLHLYAYLGVGLALPHQLWTGNEFMASPGRTLFWWSAWGVAAGAILVFRVGVPVFRNLRHGLRITSVVHEGDGTHSVYVTGRRLDLLRAEAGQFFHWRFWRGEGRTRAHPYSLSAAPDGRSLRLSVKHLGDGSGRVPDLRPGTRVLVEGPYGRLSPRVRTRHKVLLIGAGVGITPLRALAEGLEYRPGDATVIYRYRDEPLFAAEFDALADERGLQVLPLPGRRRNSRSWLPALPSLDHVDDAAILQDWFPDLEAYDAYVCGPMAWFDQVQRSLLAAGLPPEQLHHEAFEW